MTQARDLADGKFDTNTLVVDAANNRVGVGTASPSQTVEISNDGNAGLDIVDSGSGDPAIRLSVANSAGYVGTTTNHSLRFIANDSEVGRFLSGGGLTFNGDTASANALDDYEEGTFTPVAIGETTAGSGTYNYQVGEYTKIGKLVHFQISIQWSSHSGSGALRIQNLPFTSDSTTNNFASISAYISELPVTSNHRTMPFIRPNVTYISINQASGSGGPSSVGIDAAAQVLVSGSYLST